MFIFYVVLSLFFLGFRPFASKGEKEPKTCLLRVGVYGRYGFTSWFEQMCLTLLANVYAAIVQWQNPGPPSRLRGFESRLRLHQRRWTQSK